MYKTKWMPNLLYYRDIEWSVCYFANCDGPAVQRRLIAVVLIPSAGWAAGGDPDPGDP